MSFAELELLPVLLRAATYAGTIAVAGSVLLRMTLATWIDANLVRRQILLGALLSTLGWSLLLSWTPFLGDPLTIVAGIMRTPFWLFLAIVALAKTGRYAVQMLVTSGFL